MDVDVGLRVVRGLDWQWGDQDGGEGHVGTVVEVGQPSERDGGRAVVVQWDCGERCRYRCGVDGKYDLRVLDSAPAGLKHIHTRCHGCNDEQIAGMLWQCRKCFEYFLCTPCYMVGRHSLEHVFLRIDTHDINRRVNVPPRARSTAVEARGIFPGAKVVRGHNWKWKNQDGGNGNVGQVVNVTGWQNESVRSVVEVQWRGSSKKNIYRLGHKGKVDVKLIQSGASTVGHYFPAHLPLLGDPYDPPRDTLLAAGDRIKVELNPDVWKTMQEGHGGWNELMAAFIDVVGVIVHIADDGDLVVNYHSNAMFHINAAAATKVDTTVFRIGDMVRVMDDRGEVSKLQKGHGEWNDSMSMSLGQLARVVKVLPSGDVRISVSGRRWIFNPACLKRAPGEKITETVEEEIVNPLLRTQLKAMLLRLDPDTVPTAAAAGDSIALKEFLSKKPEEVNRKLHGKTALHIAAAEGFAHVMKIVLEYGPELNEQDNEGDTPLHICAHMNQEVAADLLVKAGADVNYKNAVGLFPLAVAAAIGNHSTLRVLVKSKGVNLNEKDLEGNTALHISVLAHRNECVAILLEAGADPTVYNSGCFSPFLEASKNGFYAGIEQFIGRFPEHVNMIKMDDGHSALHIAAANDHLDIVSLLSSLDMCNLDIENFTSSLTPLYLAAQRGYSRIIEALVGYGADVNAKGADGQTVLHLIFSLKTMEPPTEDTPEFAKMSEYVRSINEGRPVAPYIAMACLLVREGANPQVPSLLGVTAMTLCPPEMVPLVHQISDEQPRKRFKGSYARYGAEAFKAGSILRMQEIIKQRELKSRSPLLPVTQQVELPVLAASQIGQLNLPPKDQSQRSYVNVGDFDSRAIGQTHTAPVSTSDDVSDNQSLPQQPPPDSISEVQGQPSHLSPMPRGEAQSTSQPLNIAPPLRSSLDGDKVQALPMQTLTVENDDVRVVTSDSASSSAPVDTRSQDKEVLECALCDNPANCKFLPCGHTVMCMKCGERSKKCVECKVLITRIIPT